MLKLICALIVFTSIYHVPITVEKKVESLHDKCYQLLDTNVDEAFSVADEAFELSKENNYTYGQANSIYIQGYIHYDQHRYSKSILSYLKAIELLKPNDDFESKKLQATLNINIGNILEDHHNYEKALYHYNEAENIAVNFNIEKRLLNIYYNKSKLFLAMGDLDNSNKISLKCLTLAKKKKNEYMIGNSWNTLGLIAQKAGDFNESITHFNKLLNYHFQEDQNTWKAWAFHNIAEVHQLQGNYDSAEYYYQLDLELSLLDEDPEELFETYLKLSELYIESGKFTKGKNTAKQALTYYDKVPLTVDNYQIYSLLKEASFGIEDFNKAEEYSALYESENLRFLNQKNELLKQNEQFKMDLVLAGYEQSQQANLKINGRNQWIWRIVIGFFATLFALYLRNKWIKYQVVKELRAVDADFKSTFDDNLD